MILLAIDTSGKEGSLALARAREDSGSRDGSRANPEILEVVPLEGGTFSAQLVPQIAALLARHGVSQKDIDAFTVASGPGSFTGLRVGLAAIKGLAEILRKPIVAVSRLEAVARAGSSKGTLLAALDAGRGEVYVGSYEVGDRARMKDEVLLTREELFMQAAGRVIVTPDPGIVEAACRYGLQVEKVDSPRSDAIARLGWEKLQAGETVSPEELEANYIRRSDAEIFAKRS